MPVNRYTWIPVLYLVAPGRIELPRPCGHWILSPARLPIPPQGHLVQDKKVSLESNERAHALQDFSLLGIFLFFTVCHKSCHFEWHVKSF